MLSQKRGDVPEGCLIRSRAVFHAVVKIHFGFVGETSLIEPVIGSRIDGQSRFETSFSRLKVDHLFAVFCWRQLVELTNENQGWGNEYCAEAVGVVRNRCGKPVWSQMLESILPD